MNLPFYLTGGTALSRYYFNHRFSADLDLFVNNDRQFDVYVDRVFDVLEDEQAKGRFIVDHAKKSRKKHLRRFFLFATMILT